MSPAKSLHQILLEPTDVLFFRDGRPMSGSLTGHGAAWPLPNVTSHALHAALHRAGLVGVHEHRRGQCGHYSNQDEHRDRKFGCLLTAGPFPVRVKSAFASPSARAASGDPPLPAGRWFFPRPKDAQVNGSTAVTLRPVHDDWRNRCSLPLPLIYPVANTQPPSKNGGGEPWFSAETFDAYLRGEEFRPGVDDVAPHYLQDAELLDVEQAIGIGINPESGAVVESQFYSAHYLRVREGWRLGLFAEAIDKAFPMHDGDLIRTLLNDQPQSIIVGGQQRLCTASRSDAPQPLPLPQGLQSAGNFRRLDNAQFALKWVLLSPAIWPQIDEGQSRRGTPRRSHPGGWLPNWVCPESGQVLLRVVRAEERSRRRRLNYDGKGYASEENAPAINARLVAAIVPKPIVVTGWALPSEVRENPQGGAKSTQLAVPAGAVYYFEADTGQDAVALANALNWHGDSAGRGTRIKNRRSTLLGEKGFGLGVCGTWDFYPSTSK